MHFLHLFDDPEIDVDRRKEEYRNYKCRGDEISDKHCRRSDEGENKVCKQVGVASRKVFEEVEKIHFGVYRRGEIDSFCDSVLLFEPECEREDVGRFSDDDDIEITYKVVVPVDRDREPRDPDGPCFKVWLNSRR